MAAEYNTMGHRLSKIYTRTGDDGSTGLGDGSRLPKTDPRVEAYGTVDELNSTVGLLLASPDLPASANTELTRVQHILFDLGGELSIPGHTMVQETSVDDLETWLDAYNEHLAPLKNFILPGGSLAAAHCHLARTVCRRAERCVIALSQAESINPVGIKYLNRLSDYLFVLARVLLHHAGKTEVLWQPQS